MILIKLEGGLGNQMFQFAIASILAKKNKTKVIIEDSIYSIHEKLDGYTPRNFELSIFNNTYNFAQQSNIVLFEKLSLINKIRRKVKLNYPKIFREEQLEYCPKADILKSPVYLKGYFQSFKYFYGNESFIHEVFSFPVHKLDSVTKNLLLKIKHTNSISVHVRRGDYVSDKHTQAYHGNCSIEYYIEAIYLLASRINNITLFFFSDDCEWVKEQFQNLVYPKVFVDHNKNENSWKDMFLMSVCNHNIIANSSFSWWGAWLNMNPTKIVIAPKKWFVEDNKNTNDLIPTEWIRL